ncbi:uncharacterized protein LOC121512159 [Cheilinus undulatus]|uniref:uncharacterized protein LOC121512159 n=1 Tax=Cheilinus undulatus TaxID=241271 RepID=UPI001BD6CB6E|nr:uncharacterized protein LOC121512159 [Cheilinus undulatus]
MMQESSNKNDPSLETSEEQTTDSSTGFSLDVNSKQTVCPQLVLPPLTQPESAPECLRMKRCHTPKLPPISLLEQTNNISSNLTIKGCTKDSMPWIENPLLSKSRSAEFCLPEISLSSLDALLHTVTQRLRRKRGGGGDEEPWRQLQSDHLLMTVSEQSLKERSIGQPIDWYTNKKNSAKIEAATEASVGECRVSRKKGLSPLFFAPKPKLILRMTKKNLMAPNVL